MLRVDAINKSFGGVRALRDASIEVRPHEVVGLIGENGAGKSTLMRILSGSMRPNSGVIAVDGSRVALRDTHQANECGIALVFQEQSLLVNMSVAENIFLAQEGPFTRFGVVGRGRMMAAARACLAKVGLDIDPARKAGELSFAARQMVELAKALALEDRTDAPLTILLDEPTSVLESKDIAILFDRMRALKARASFIFVSHRLDEVLEISDRVYVMKDGAVVAERSADVSSVSELHAMMVGRELDGEYYREARQASSSTDIVLEARGLTVDGVFHDVDFALRRGEVLGIAGVIGSGREGLARTLFGFLPQSAGTLRINGQETILRSPTQAVAAGIGYVPRERRVEGLVMDMSVAANVTSGQPEGGDATWRHRPPPREEDRRRLDTTTGDQDAKLGASLPQIERRQPAEDRTRTLVDGALAHPDPRPSDAGPRRRSEGGGLRSHPRSLVRRHRDRADLRYIGGDDRSLPHDPGDA